MVGGESGVVLDGESPNLRGDGGLLGGGVEGQEVDGGLDTLFLDTDGISGGLVQLVGGHWVLEREEEQMLTDCDFHSLKMSMLIDFLHPNKT